MLASRFSGAVCSFLVVACAGGGTGRIDGGRRDGSVSLRDGGNADGGGGVTRPSGQHRCGGGCIDDLVNQPENGCRFGCNEPCPTPPDGATSCTALGECSFARPPPFHQEGDRCVCTPMTCESMAATCGTPDDGCGTPLRCGTCETGTCMAGTCACSEDGYEPNDDHAFVTTGLGAYGDAGWGGPSGDPPGYDGAPRLMWTGNIDVSTDEDWYRFDITDETDADNPNIIVTLDGTPAGSDYDLAAYYVCSEGGDDSTCNLGTLTAGPGVGCSSTAGGTASEAISLATYCRCGTLCTDDSGTLYVRVWAATWGGSCGEYTLRIWVY